MKKTAFVLAPRPQNVSNGVKPTVSKGSTTQQHGVFEQFPSFLPEIPLCVLARLAATAQQPQVMWITRFVPSNTSQTTKAMRPSSSILTIFKVPAMLATVAKTQLENKGL